MKLSTMKLRTMKLSTMKLSTMKLRVLGVFIFAGGILASGCANLDTIAPGTTSTALEASRGKPSRIWSEANGGATWEYPLGPEGRYTYMAHIGADGRITRVDQVLGWDVFGKIGLGMTTEEVEHLLGRPYSKLTYPLTDRTVWSWRFVETVWFRCFFTYFGTDGKVVGTGSKDEETGDVGKSLAIPC